MVVKATVGDPVPVTIPLALRHEFELLRHLDAPHMEISCVRHQQAVGFPGEWLILPQLAPVAALLMVLLLRRDRFRLSLALRPPWLIAREPELPHRLTCRAGFSPSGRVGGEGWFGREHAHLHEVLLEEFRSPPEWEHYIEAAELLASPALRPSWKEPALEYPDESKRLEDAIAACIAGTPTTRRSIAVLAVRSSYPPASLAGAVATGVLCQSPKGEGSGGEGPVSACPRRGARAARGVFCLGSSSLAALALHAHRAASDYTALKTSPARDV